MEYIFHSQTMSTDFASCQHKYHPLSPFGRTAVSPLSCAPSCFHSDVCVGQSQDDSIVGMKQSKQIPPALPVSGNLSSSNPDLLQSHHRILDFNNQPGVFSNVMWIFIMCNLSIYGNSRLLDFLEIFGIKSDLFPNI